MNNSEPILVGEFVHAVDAKGRVAIPSSFRKKLGLGPGDKLVLSRGLTQCIEAHTEAEWASHLETMLGGLPLYDPQAHRLRRSLLSQANEVELDGQGRVLLPRNLKETAAIGGEAVVTGMGRFFELWEPDRYRQYRDQAGTSFDADLIGLDRMRSQGRYGDDRQTQGDVPPAGDGK